MKPKQWPKRGLKTVALRQTWALANNPLWTDLPHITCSNLIPCWKLTLTLKVIYFSSKCNCYCCLVTLWKCYFTASKRFQHFFHRWRKLSLLPYVVNHGICLKGDWSFSTHTRIDFSQRPVAQSMYQQQRPTVCTRLPHSNKLIMCFRLQQFSLTKPESQRTLTLFKWLLKHVCCPWILMLIFFFFFPNVQTSEGEISKLLTPQRISSGHNMS